MRLCHLHPPSSIALLLQVEVGGGFFSLILRMYTFRILPLRKTCHSLVRYFLPLLSTPPIRHSFNIYLRTSCPCHKLTIMRLRSADAARSVLVLLTSEHGSLNPLPARLRTTRSRHLIILPFARPPIRRDGGLGSAVINEGPLSFGRGTAFGVPLIVGGERRTPSGDRVPGQLGEVPFHGRVDP